MSLTTPAGPCWVWPTGSPLFHLRNMLMVYDRHGKGRALRPGLEEARLKPRGVYKLAYSFPP
jgi:hypothetical protein